MTNKWGVAAEEVDQLSTSLKLSEDLGKTFSPCCPKTFICILE